MLSPRHANSPFRFLDSFSRHRRTDSCVPSCCAKERSRRGKILKRRSNLGCEKELGLFLGSRDPPANLRLTVFRSEEYRSRTSVMFLSLHVPDETAVLQLHVTSFLSNSARSADGES